MHLTCGTVRSLDLNFQFPKAALLTRPRAARIHFDIRQLHRCCVWLREYFFAPNSNGEHVTGRNQNLADLYSGPISNRWKVFDDFIEGDLSVQGSWNQDAFGFVKPDRWDSIPHTTNISSNGHMENTGVSRAEADGIDIKTYFPFLCQFGKGS